MFLCSAIYVHNLCLGNTMNGYDKHTYINTRGKAKEGGRHRLAGHPPLGRRNFHGESGYLSRRFMGLRTM